MSNEALRKAVGRVKPCPECGSEFVHVDSSRDLGLSEVRCSDCGHTLQKRVPEERIEQLWNKLDRSKMPVVEEDAPHGGPFPSLESHPYEYRLRYSSSGVDIWVPCKASDMERLLSDPHFQVRHRSHDFDMKDLAARQRKEATITTHRANHDALVIRRGDVTARLEAADGLLRVALRYLDPRQYSEVIARITTHLKAADHV